MRDEGDQLDVYEESQREAAARAGIVRLPRSVPRDPESVENERAVQDAFKRIGPGPCVKELPFDSELPFPFLPPFGEVARVALKPGDVFVVHADMRLSASQVARIRRQFREQFPDHKVLILDKGLRLSVASEDSA